MVSIDPSVDENEVQSTNKQCALMSVPDWIPPYTAASPFASAPRRPPPVLKAANREAVRLTLIFKQFSRYSTICHATDQAQALASAV
jgi:hypothetical protein